MRPDRRDWTAFHSVAPPAGLRTSHVDFLLGFVLSRSATDATDLSARLDAMEHTLTSLTSQWRTDASFAPARELRLSAETLGALLEWAEMPVTADRRGLERLGVYASGALTDGSVPAGWVRVHLV